MSMHLRRIAIGLAAAVITMLGSAQAYASAPEASPDINPVPCASSSTWVRLYSTTGEHCYTGNGTVTVNLFGVHEMRVFGLRDVCLTLVPLKRICYLRGSSAPIIFSPPIYVRLLSVTTS